MMFRAQEPSVQFKVQEQDLEQPGFGHIRLTLNNIINKLNHYILNNKSKILDLHSDRSRDVSSIAMTVLGCVLQHPGEIVGNILSVSNLQGSSVQVFSMIDLKEDESVDKIVVVARFIEALAFIKNYHWKTGYLGYSSLRGDLNAAIETAGYDELKYKELHQRYINEAIEKKQAEQERQKIEIRNRIENNANILRDYYKNNTNFIGLKSALAESETEVAKMPGFFKQPVERNHNDLFEDELMCPNTYFLLYCNKGDDKKDPCFNVYSLLARCLKDTSIFEDVGVSVECERKWYTLFVGSSQSTLISKIEMNNTKYYMLGVSLEVADLKQMVVDKKIEAVLSMFTSLSVSYMIDNETISSQNYLLEYIKNKKSYNINEKQASETKSTVNCV